MVSRGCRLSLSLMGCMLLTLVAFGCGEDRTTGTEEGEERGTSPSPDDDYFLIPDGGTQVEGNVTETLELRVFLYAHDGGEAVDGAQIDFEIVEQEGDAASLSTRSTTTGEDGSATVDLRTGAEPDMVTVRAENARSNAVEFDVDIQPQETGDLELDLYNSSSDIIELSDVDVRVYRNGDYGCSEFEPLRQREEGDVAEEVAPELSDGVTVEDLGADKSFVATAVARGEQGQIAAGGCLEDIPIEADEVTQRELALQLVPLNPAGRYETTSHWDFSEALEDSGSVGSTIMRVLDVFENPGQALYDEIINLLGNFVSGYAAGGVDLFLDVTGLDDTLIDAINDAVENNDALSNIQQAGMDLRDAVTNLEVTSELTIGKVGSDYEFRGTDNWLGITVYWRHGCDDSDPDDCGAIDLTADSDGDLGELGVVSSEWTGRISSYNQLQINKHPVSFNYGKLISYLLEDVILPEMTDGNADSLSGAFSYWVCDGLVSRVANQDGDVCAPDPFPEDACFDMAGACETAASTVFGFADLLVDNLEYDLGLEVRGEGILLETDSDGFVDAIEDGVYEGKMHNEDLGQSQASDVPATWEAEVVDGDTDNL
ncbi:MAG: hypothetical protein ACOCV2_07325 [Persicimonas sp.]